jgi:putative hydrolase of the HAD superfamily
VKKTAGFYERICRVLETKPQDIVHVGDHYEFDYLVPRSLGIHAYYLDRMGERNGEFVLRDLRELNERLAISSKLQAPNST